MLSLGGSAIPEDNDNISVCQVTLQHLKYLYLYGDLRRVVKILERLVFSHPLNSFSIVTKDSAVESVLQALIPYVRLHLQDDLGVRDRLELTALTFRTVLLISAQGKHGVAEYTPYLTGFKVGVAQGTPRDVLENLCHDLVMSIPRLERVGDLHTNLPSRKLEDLLIAMPNIETLNLSSVKMSEGFLQPNPNEPYAESKLLPSLKSLRLGTVALCNHDWGPLKAYLGHQTSDGQAVSLKITGDIPHMCPLVATEIENLVGEFSRNFNYATRCPLGRCRGEAEESEGGGQTCTTAE